MTLASNIVVFLIEITTIVVMTVNVDWELLSVADGNM